MTNWTVNCDECGKTISDNKQKFQDKYYQIDIGKKGHYKKFDFCSKECLIFMLDKYIKEIDEEEFTEIEISISLATNA